MSRHHGQLIDLRARTLRLRDGETVVPLDRLEVGEAALYCAFQYPAHARFHSLESWFIREHGWVITRFHLLPGARPMAMDWYVDIDRVDVDEGRTWRSTDRYLDIAIHDGRRYEVWDADELADGLEQGAISLENALAALRDLDLLCRELRRCGFSGRALLADYAPALPR